MPRIRTIKPEFWMNEDVAEWSRDTRLVFLGLITYCQDHGVGSANVRRLASQILPMDEPVEASTIIRRALDECSRTGQIVLYEVDGRPLYWVSNFLNHQRVDRPGKRDLPLPTEAQTASSRRREVDPPPTLTSDDEPRLTLVEDSTNVRRTLDEESSTSSGVEWSGKGVEKNIPRDAPRPAVQLPITAEVSVHAEPPRPDVERLCETLHAKLVETDYKPLPKITKQWRDQARLLLDKDDRNLDQAVRLVVWALENEFWSTNIASMGKFRQQYPKLLAAARREHAGQQARTRSVKDQRVAATLELGRRMAAQEAAGQLPAWGLPDSGRKAIHA